MRDELGRTLLHQAVQHGLLGAVATGVQRYAGPRARCGLIAGWTVTASTDHARPARSGPAPQRPGIQFVPASGTPAIAAASTVSATRSSRSR